MVLKGKLISEKVPLGIDLGESSIKIVELKHLRSKFALKRFTIDQIAVQESEQEDDGEKIGEYLKECLDKHGIKTKKAYLALKNSDVMIRPMTFPPMPKKELEQAVKYESDKHLMMPKNQANIDWQITDSTDKQISVLLLAARKDLISKYHQVCETAGIKLAALDVEVFALLRLIRFLEYHEPQDEGERPVGGELTLTLDMGSSSTTLLFTKNNRYVFSRNISLGGTDFTRAISQELALSFRDAEQNQSQNNYLEYDSVRGRALDLLREIERSVEYVNAQNLAKGDPEKLYVTGGGWRTKGLLDFVRDNVGMNPMIINPFKHIKSRGELVTEGMMASIATGLALRRWKK